LSEESFGGGGGVDRAGGNLHRPPLPRRDDSRESTESWEFRSATLEAPIARLESLSESLDGAGKTEGSGGANIFEHPDGDSGGGIPRQRSSDV